MVGPFRDLSDVSRKGGTIEVRCKGCGHTCMFVPAELEAWLASRRKDTGWRNFSRYLTCSGCGRSSPVPSWSPLDPPPVAPLLQGRIGTMAGLPRAIAPHEIQSFRKR